MLMIYTNICCLIFVNYLILITILGLLLNQDWSNDINLVF